MGTEGTMAPISRVSEVISTFRPSKIFKPNTPPSSSTSPPSYTSIDFDDSGEFLLLSRTDDTIQLFNTKAGAHAKELKSQKYGSALARFTHHSTSIVYASTKIDDGIRYLSMHDNSFIRYFRGHTGRVTSLCMSPGGDQFLSASMDDTVKLWDCRSANAHGNLNFVAPWLTAYDPSATVIAVASPPAGMIALYDLKNYDKPPFVVFDMRDIEEKVRHLGHGVGEGWTGLEFSNNGKFVLVATGGPGHFVLDAFSGELVHYLHRAGAVGGGVARLAPGDLLGGSEDVYTQADASFSPDGRYVVSGAGKQTGLLVWDLQERERPGKILEPMAELPGPKSAAVVAYNPRHNLLASADREVVMWAPDLDIA